MFKMLFLLIFSIVTFFDPIKSNSIECNYEYKSYTILQNIFHCNVINDPQLTTRESSEVILINSRGSEINDEVVGFYVHQKTVQYFPKGLEKYFKNLKAISISVSKLKEVTQSDLKPFPKLIFLELYLNSLVFIEPDLFNFNPNLQLISFGNNKIKHIDSNVFDNLTHLTHLWVHYVRCINENGSIRQQTLQIIKKLKNNCKDADFETLERKFKEFEDQVKGLRFDEFEVKMRSFEDEVKNMKFYDSSYFSGRIEAIKISKKSSSFKSPVPESTTETQKSFKPSSSNAENYCKIEENSDFEIKISNLTEALNSLESSQTKLKDSVDKVKLSIDSQDSKLIALQESQSKLQTSTHDSLKATQESLESSQRGLKFSQDEMLSTQGDIKTSISDIETSVNNVKTSQAEVKSALNKLRAGQNGIENLLNKASKNENLEENFIKFEEKLESLDRKLENLEEKSKENGEKFEVIKQDLAITRHKISINVQEAIKGIEKRLTKKIEDILEEKMRQILDENFSRLRNV